jgi:molybdenum cofactor biosynthesis enzyme MoaA
MVFLDVTNRCNMNCPICIANIPSMGFEFHPPIEYFEHVLGEMGKWDPGPVVQLFGGEPTVREDLFDIIAIARDNGLDVRIVTNGLKLADEGYCRRICELKVHVLIAFDGRSPGIYKKLRKSEGAYKKKVRALENLRKHSRHKNTIMCCVARKVNDNHMRDLIDFCHEGRDYIKCLHLIPLNETWPAGEFETDIATTSEDVEHIIDDAFPEGRVEFLPMGPSESLRRSLAFFGTAPLKFGGVHPNCETATYLLTDGEQYWPLSHFLKQPLEDIAEEVVRRAAEIDPKLAKLSPNAWFQRLRGRVAVLKTFGGLVFRSINFRRLLRGSRTLAVLRILGGLLIGRSLKEQLRRHTRVQGAMLMVVLPFEEFHSVESARLQECPSGFAYEDPGSGEVKTVPVCLWGLYKTDIQRRIMARYHSEEAHAAPDQLVEGALSENA